MSSRRRKNIEASIRQQLLNRARERGEDYNFVLIRYALERFVYRLSKSEYADQFILKGALLLQLWTDRPYRATKDLDLLGRGEIAVPRFEAIFKEVCGGHIEDDGLSFDASSVTGEEIKEEQEYGGLRMKFQAWMGDVPIRLQVDIGFGDAITPASAVIEYPSMFDLPAARIQAYPRETVVSEKFQAMVMLGMGNSRMKDYFDLWILSREFDFDGSLLREAISKTFARRRTDIPEGPPVGLSDDFCDNAGKQAQWRAFVRRGNLEEAVIELQSIVHDLRTFLMPPTKALVSGDTFEVWWTAGRGWQEAY